MTSHRLHRLVDLVIGLALVAAGTFATAAAAGTGSSQAASGTLNLDVRFSMVSNPFACPADVLPADVPPAATAECRARTSTASVRGLGTVSLAYTWPLGWGPPTCAADFAKALAATGRLSVAGKGEMTFTLAEAARCVRYGVDLPQNEPQELTVTGGTGVFATASGRGRLEARALAGGVGTETLTGTLEVQGLDFDLTPPVISGAVSKTARTKQGVRNARVTYRVTALDDRDGPVPVTCTAKSGSRFRIGRTNVSCEAVDSSANSATASFTITVKKGR